MNRVLLRKKLATLRSFAESMNSHENLFILKALFSEYLFVNLTIPTSISTLLEPFSILKKLNKKSSLKG